MVCISGEAGELVGIGTRSGGKRCFCRVLVARTVRVRSSKSRSRHYQYGPDLQSVRIDRQEGEFS